MSRKTEKEIKTAANPHQSTNLRAQDPFLARETERYDSPLPSREFIFQLVEAENVPLPVDDLVMRLSITADERPFFERRLAAMAREGDLMINRKGALCLPQKVDLIAGRVQGHPDGFGFLIPDDGSDDLYLGPKEMDKVLHGDRVLGQQIGFDRRGRREGKIAEILERANTTLVGRFRLEHGVSIVTAEDKRISQEILVPPKETGRAKAGQIVVVELIQQPERHVQPVGRVVEILGNYDDPGMEIEIALRKHNLPHVFSDAAQAQAAEVPAKVRKADLKAIQGVKREDLRDLPLVTIDGETAKDFDDAVYAEKKGKGWRLVVAIADVSHYVQPDDALDVTSRERGNSVYFPRRVIPMLPEQLSNGICSLNPDVARLCMVCDMEVGAKGAIKKYRFYPAVMHSQARLTYTKVWDMIEHPKGPTARQYKKVLPHIQELYALFQAFSKARAKRGAIDFETVETEIRFDDHGKIREIVPVHRNDAHKLIEECMLAANVCAADILIKHKHPGLYRVHEGPKPEKLDVLREYLRTCGLTLGGDDDPTAEDYARLLQAIKARPDAELLQTMLLRSLSQAVYTPDNKGHFGLGYPAYAHFTSPIRRYPDLLVHRSIKAILAGKKYKPSQKWDALGIQCSMTERRADDASRDVLNFLKCYYMQDKVGEEFEGSVAAVTSFGMFVLLDDLYVEGLVHVSELGSDYFHYDERRRELRGERSGKVYKLTDRLKVKVVRVDLETSKIDFTLAPVDRLFVPPPAERDAARGGSRRRGKQGDGKVRETASPAQSAPVAVGKTPAPAAPRSEAPTAEAAPKSTRSSRNRRSRQKQQANAKPVTAAIPSVTSVPAPAPATVAPNPERRRSSKRPARPGEAKPSQPASAPATTPAPVAPKPPQASAKPQPAAKQPQPTPKPAPAATAPTNAGQGKAQPGKTPAPAKPQAAPTTLAPGSTSTAPAVAKPAAPEKKPVARKPRQAQAPASTAESAKAAPAPATKPAPRRNKPATGTATPVVTAGVASPPPAAKPARQPAAKQVAALLAPPAPAPAGKPEPTPAAPAQGQATRRSRQRKKPEGSA
ncbi:ribonuclease R [Chitiniphilus eburneus]|uniref:Ribonuclease R n=1 Tax=Chitiniphilus eburneus TaxID=2571148 RepID=A0A4U0PYE2_9NEIS|nr:ribonuclease R [Chitiniphilus eburneus]TJZ73290.1 ribonuclease R [Chitiniphilus eburneus]